MNSGGGGRRKMKGVEVLLGFECLGSVFFLIYRIMYIVLCGDSNIVLFQMRGWLMASSRGMDGWPLEEGGLDRGPVEGGREGKLVVLGLADH